MAATTGARSAGDVAPTRSRAVERSTETKHSSKTTELYVLLATVIGILVAAAVIDESESGGFGAERAWLYVTIASAAYMVSRGLAKAGSRDPYVDTDR